MAIRMAHLDMLRNLQDLRLTIYRVFMASQLKEKQKKSWED
jgi:hypothetical protein